MPVAGLLLSVLSHASVVLACVVWIAIAILYGWFTYPGRYNKAALEENLKALLNVLDLPGKADVRCTLYAPDRKGEYLTQITNYIPSGIKASSRKLMRSQGIVGKAFTRKAYWVAILESDVYKDPQAFRKHMIEEYGFSEEHAHKLTADRRSYLAAPIINKNNDVLGVLYCDSFDPEAFGEASSDKSVNQQDSHSSWKTGLTFQQRIEELMPFFRVLLSD